MLLSSDSSHTMSKKINCENPCIMRCQGGGSTSLSARYSSCKKNEAFLVSACYKGLIPRVKGHPCQTGWAHSGGPAQTHQVVSWCILAHAFYSSNPGPQHHARVWMSFQQYLNLNFLQHSTCNLYAFQFHFQLTSTCNLHAFWSHLQSYLPCVTTTFMLFSCMFRTIEFGKLYPKRPS